MIERAVDLLRLRNATLPRLLDALEQLLEMGSPAASLGVVCELAVDEAVRLVRAGSRTDLLVVGDALATFLGGPRGANVKRGAPGAYDTLSGLLPVLSAASSPASRGGEALVLRSWSGKAQAALAAVARTGSMPRAELREGLRVSQSHLSHMLKDLEAAHLVERVGGPGRRSVDVRITAKGRQLVFEQVPPPPPPPQPLAPAAQRRVRRARGNYARCGDAGRRLDAALELPGGPSARFRRTCVAG